MSCEQPTKQNCSLRLSCKQLTLKSLIEGLHMIMVKFGPNSSTFVKSVSDICYLLVALWKIHCLYKIHVLYICLIFCAFTGRTWRQKWRWFCNLIKMRLNMREIDISQIEKDIGTMYYTEFNASLKFIL